MSHLKKQKNKKGFLPEIVSKNKSQLRHKQIKEWGKKHLGQLPEIPESAWSKELEGRIENIHIDDSLSLEDSLRKSLTLINTFQRHEPGEEKSTKFLMLEMNEFFLQMAEELKYLKSNLIFDETKENQKESFKDNIYKGSDKRIAKIFKDIKLIENKIQENVSEMKIVEEERKELHQEIRSSIDLSLELNKKTLLDKNFPYYLLNENKSEEIIKDDIKTILKNKEKEQKPKNDLEKNFIEKNIQLAKNRTMYNSKCSLTDEEKIKLAKLLIEMEEKVETNPTKYLKSYEEIVNNYDIHTATLEEPPESSSDTESVEEDIGFKLYKKDSKLLIHLNEELEKLDEKKYAFTETNSDVQFQYDRPWRKLMMENKLNDIEKNLIHIANEKNEEKEKSKNDMFIINRAEVEQIRREYRESFEEMKYAFETGDKAENG
ncbi:uncharacterized protein PF3D7_1120000-like [Onthophagus taurus]|uniref:uncharacterized protein PF3D7_1120000-like n=1 Tax=Onthophagus taurus TaxID=166361 RepID=UPI0039BE5BB7